MQRVRRVRNNTSCFQLYAIISVHRTAHVLLVSTRQGSALKSLIGSTIERTRFATTNNIPVDEMERRLTFFARIVEDKVCEVTIKPQSNRTKLKVTNINAFHRMDLRDFSLSSIGKVNSTY